MRKIFGTHLVLAALLLPISPCCASPAAPPLPNNVAAVKTTYAPIARHVVPEVVTVSTSTVVAWPSSQSDTALAQLFHDQMPYGAQVTPKQVNTSIGAGVIVDASGLIATAASLVEGADQIKVSLSDQQEHAASIVSVDAWSGLAILRVTDSHAPLPAASVGNSDVVEVGDLVLAVGDPFSVGLSVRMGMVSAVADLQASGTSNKRFIQTDALINPGDSGGGLFDVDGDLIGIITTIVSPKSDATGVGFAIPSNLLKSVLASAVTSRAPERPWLGATLQTMTPELAAAFQNPSLRGILVVSVVPKGPAALAGLQANDVVTSLNGSDISDPDLLNYQLATMAIGSQVQLGVVRDGKWFATSLMLEPAPEPPPRDLQTISGHSPLAGMQIENLSPAVAQELSLDEASHGVVVSSVAPASDAINFGFQRGDIIVSINGQAVETTSDVVRIAATKTNIWKIAIGRGGKRILANFADKNGQ
jgi:S1-C subfamily serine protease